MASKYAVFLFFGTFMFNKVTLILDAVVCSILKQERGLKGYSHENRRTLSALPALKSTL